MTIVLITLNFVPTNLPTNKDGKCKGRHGQHNSFQSKGKITCKASNKANDQGQNGGMAITQDQIVQLEELITSMTSHKLEEKGGNTNFHKCAHIYPRSDLTLRFFCGTRFVGSINASHDAHFYGVKTPHVTFSKPLVINSSTIVTCSMSHA